MMEKQKSYNGKRDFFIELLLMLTLFSSCQKEISMETREFLHGTWAQEGFTDMLRQKHDYKMTLEAMSDTIGFIHIDLCYGEKKGYKKWWSDPSNPDSLTDEERYSTNSIWILEDDCMGRENAFRLFYVGDDYFLSEPLANSERKYCRIISRKDNRIEYGLVDENNDIKASLSLELLYRSKKLFYERFSEGWAKLYEFYADKIDFISKNFMYGVKGIKLYKSASPNDSLLHIYSHDDIQEGRGIRIYYNGSTAWAERLQSRPTPVAETENTHIYGNDDGCFFVTWRGDTAFLHYNKEDEFQYDYYMVLTR